MLLALCVGTRFIGLALGIRLGLSICGSLGFQLLLLRFGICLGLGLRLGLQLRILAGLRLSSGRLFLGLLFGLGLALKFRLAGLLFFLRFQLRLALGFSAVLGGPAGEFSLARGSCCGFPLALALLLQRDVGFLFHLGWRRLDNGLRFHLGRRRRRLYGLLNRSLIPQLGFFAARRAALPLHAKRSATDA